MSADPLADLLNNMYGEIYGGRKPDFYSHHEADWLRANRDRVLEALGGQLIDGVDHIEAWWFPKGAGE